jgi:LuxR family maltose regulon positive regulatory protein
VNQALAAKDFDGAARLVEQNAHAMLTRGEMATLLQWFDALPEDVTRRRPLLCIGIAWVLTLAGAIERVERLLRQAEAQFERDSETPVAREVVGNAAAMRAFFAMMAGDDGRALELAQRAEALLPERSIQARSLLPYTLGTAYRGQGQFEKAAEAFAREVHMGEASGDLLIWATGMCEVVNTRRVQGRLREAGETCRLALRRLAERGAVQFGSLAKLEVAKRSPARTGRRSGAPGDWCARMEAWTCRRINCLPIGRSTPGIWGDSLVLESLRFAGPESCVSF